MLEPQEKYDQISVTGISPIMPVTELTVSAGVVCHEGQPVRCYWCKWQPQPEEITGVDGLLLGGFTPVRDLAKLKACKLLVHSCHRKRAMPLVRLIIEAEAKRSLKRSVAEAIALEVV